MPIVDKVIDIPALSWCSVSDAVLWIKYGQVPVAHYWESLLPDRHPALTSLYRPTDSENYGAFGPPDRTAEYHESISKLYDLVCEENGVTLRGRPATSIKEFGVGTIPTLVCEKFGELQDIPTSRLRLVKIMSFRSSATSNILLNGRIYSEITPPEGAWGYGDVVVDFQDLYSKHPMNTKDPIRFGSDIQIIGEKKGKPGRKEDFSSELLLSLMAITLQDKGESKTDEQEIEWLQLAYSIAYPSEKEPSRATIQNRVMTPLNAARRAYANGLRLLNESQKSKM